MASAVASGRLAELASFGWRELVNERALRRDERRWTAWTVSIAAPFVGAGGLLLALEPLTFPVALMSFAHAWAIPMLYARRGARSIGPLPEQGPPRASAQRGGQGMESSHVALGLLGDLVGHQARELLRGTGLVMERGELGVWLVGESGALLVRAGGRRVDCWCVRVAEPGELPGADRASHLLLALREDEAGFATIANLAFSGAAWRVRARMGRRCRPALDAARAAA